MASLKKCIEAKCKDCTYDQAAPGTWREQVENCTVKSCALWEVRPVTMATIILNRKSAKPETEVDYDEILASLDDEDAVVA